MNTIVNMENSGVEHMLANDMVTPLYDLFIEVIFRLKTWNVCIGYSVVWIMVLQLWL